MLNRLKTATSPIFRSIRSLCGRAAATVHLSRHQLTYVYKELVPLENITILKKGPKSLEFGQCETSDIEGNKKAFLGVCSKPEVLPGNDGAKNAAGEIAAGHSR